MSDYVICINNDSNPASLILGKVYRTLPDAEAANHKMLQIRYLYHLNLMSTYTIDTLFPKQFGYLWA